MSSMGMDKSGSETIANDTSYHKLTTFVARSGYPSTVITNSALVMNINGTGTLRYNVSFSSPFGSGQNMRVVKNGSTVVDGPFTANSTRTSGTISVAVGDTLELQAQANLGGAFQIVSGGNTTFLEFNQLTSLIEFDAAQAVAWDRTATTALTALATDPGTTVTWGRTASMGLQSTLSASRTVTWSATADIYQGQTYDIAAAQTVTWGSTASLMLVPKSTPLPSIFDVADVSMSIHTVDGRAIGDFPCKVVTTFSWTREANEVSVCSFDVATQAAPELVEDLRPWVHWVTVWHDGQSVWTGPLQTIRIRTETTSIVARDTSTFMWRTRVPVTRTWADTKPENIARDLWTAMLQLHRVRATPTVLDGVVSKSFTITAKAEQRMMHQLMDDLTKVGLQWTVVAGRAVLGRFSRDPVVTLEDCDFMVELERKRDGTQTFNDVRVQGQNWAQTAVAEIAGLRLQTLVSMDDLFGASNIQRATLEYAQDSARLRDELIVPGSASLHHGAPVTLDDLVPGKAFAVHSGALSQLMRLDQVTVTGGPESIDVQVGLVALEPEGEIAKLVGGGL